MLKKLAKGIGESKKEKERLDRDLEKVVSKVNEIEKKAFVVQENYKNTLEVLFSSLPVIFLSIHVGIASINLSIFFPV